MPGSLAEGVSPAAMLMGDRGPRRWESWAVGRSDWWWVCTDEGRLRCATLSLLSWLSVLVGFGRGPECLENFTRIKIRHGFVWAAKRRRDGADVVRGPSRAANAQPTPRGGQQKRPLEWVSGAVARSPAEADRGARKQRRTPLPPEGLRARERCAPGATEAEAEVTCALHDFDIVGVTDRVADVMALVCRAAGLRVCPRVPHENKRPYASRFAAGECRSGPPPQACWPSTGEEADRAEALVASRHPKDVLLHRAVARRFATLLSAYKLDGARGGGGGTGGGANATVRYAWTTRAPFAARHEPRPPQQPPPPPAPSTPSRAEYERRARAFVWPDRCYLLPRRQPSRKAKRSRHGVRAPRATTWWSASLHVHAPRWWARTWRAWRKWWRARGF